MGDDEDSESALDRKIGIYERLPHEVGEKLSAHLKDRIGDCECDVCGNDNWVINPSIGSPVFLSLNKNWEPSGVNLAISHPSVIMHCNNCGNTKFLSLTWLGFDFPDGAIDE